MKNLNTFKNAIKSTVRYLPTQKATFNNGHTYGKYFNRDWEFMSINRVVKDLSRYNDHLVLEDESGNFAVSDQLVAALRAEIAKHGLTNTTHVGCFDLLSNAIFKRACLDGSSSVEEIKAVFNI